MLDLRGVWEYDRDCFSNCFLFRNTSKLCFFFNLFMISAYQNIKIYIKN
jgi:hypothetical protein